MKNWPQQREKKFILLLRPKWGPHTCPRAGQRRDSRLITAVLALITHWYPRNYPLLLLEVPLGVMRDTRWVTQPHPQRPSSGILRGVSPASRVTARCLDWPGGRCWHAPLHPPPPAPSSAPLICLAVSSRCSRDPLAAFVFHRCFLGPWVHIRPLCPCLTSGSWLTNTLSDFTQKKRVLTLITVMVVVI